MGTPKSLSSHFTRDQLEARYRAVQRPSDRSRWHALWLVAGGRSRRQVAALLGVAPTTLRELRLKGGRSRWRAFYRRVGDRLVVAALGPEAQADRYGFERAVTVACDRLEGLEA
jgi:hypothetical protein